MEINKRNRTELKSYFVRNAIPTESNFAELVDAMLNQKDDGIVKMAGDPLSIEAAGGDTSKKVINFYQNFTDPKPNWVLSLNPGDKPGFNISDGEGNSRLFIDQNTGNVGIGTTNPTDKLVVFDPTTSGAGGITIRRGNYARLSIISDNYWSGIELRRDSAGAAGRPHIDFTNDLTTNFGIRVSAPTNDALAIEGGNVGIGTTNPTSKLEVNGDLAVTGAQSFGRQTRQMINLWRTNYGIGVQSSTQYYRTDKNFAWYKGGSHHGSELNAGGGTIQMVIKNGNVGIGTNDPKQKLDVNGSLRVNHIVQEAWQNVAANKFQSGWVNYGHSYNPAGYFKDSLGIVHLRGLVKNGTVGGNATIFTLPTGYRPQGRELQATIRNNQELGRIDILNNGRIIPFVGNPGWFSLDGITFRAASPTLTPIPVTPVTPVTPIRR